MATNIKFSKFDNRPWGFRLAGGSDFPQPLTVIRVTEGSLAECMGLRVGDVIVRLNEQPINSLSHGQAHEALNLAGNNFVLAVHRVEDTETLVEAITKDNIEPYAINLDDLPPLQPLEEILTKLTAEPIVDEPKEEEEIIEESFEEKIEIIEEVPQKPKDENSEEIPNQNLTDEEIAQLIIVEEELLPDKGVLGVDFKKLRPRAPLFKDSKVFEELQKEATAEPPQVQELKRRTTFLQKPERPVPKPKSDQAEETNSAPPQEAYKVVIKKQTKKSITERLLEKGLLEPGCVKCSEQGSEVKMYVPSWAAEADTQQVAPQPTSSSDISNSDKTPNFHHIQNFETAVNFDQTLNNIQNFERDVNFDQTLNNIQNFERAKHFDQTLNNIQNFEKTVHFDQTLNTDRTLNTNRTLNTLITLDADKIHNFDKAPNFADSTELSKEVSNSKTVNPDNFVEPLGPRDSVKPANCSSEGDSGPLSPMNKSGGSVRPKRLYMRNRYFENCVLRGKRSSEKRRGSRLYRKGHYVSKIVDSLTQKQTRPVRAIRLKIRGHYVDGYLGRKVESARDSFQSLVSKKSYGGGFQRRGRYVKRILAQYVDSSKVVLGSLCVSGASGSSSGFMSSLSNEIFHRGCKRLWSEYRSESGWLDWVKNLAGVSLRVTKKQEGLCKKQEPDSINDSRRLSFVPTVLYDGLTSRIGVDFTRVVVYAFVPCASMILLYAYK